MNEEVLAAAAVYLYTAYNNFLEAHLNTRNKAMQKYRMMKNKQLRRNCWLPSSRNRTRKMKKPPIQQLPAEPRAEFTNLIPMSNIDFEYILEEITPVVEHHEIFQRELIAKQKLAVTLQYLATGDSYETLGNQFGISTERILKIITEVCSAINYLLRDLLKLPASEDEWLSKAEGFQFPNCVGALDKKQITLQPSFKADEEDCKGRLSIELLTLVDSDFCFIYAEVGCQDEKNSENLLQKINNGTLGLPPSKILPESETSVPYVFLADGVFSLSKQIMILFTDKHEPETPEAVFNEHLTCSRVVIENAFGVMSSVFKIFQKPLQLNYEDATIVITTCVLLHNFLRKSNSSRHIYSPPDTFDMYANNQLIQPGSWRNNCQNNFIPTQFVACKAEDDSGIQTRLDFMNYFSKKMT